ncbi:MAG: GNAT family N-acetyltransferase, partial [Erysipelotrichaceae bacterium]
DFRGSGVGTLLMQAAHTHLPVGARVHLGAQCTAIPFYEKLGYQPFGEVFLDAQIEHIMMEKCL